MPPDTENSLALPVWHLPDEIAPLQKRIKQLEQGIQAFIDGDYPNPRDHRPGKCQHDRNYWEDCCQCNDEYFEELLGKK